MGKLVNINGAWKEVKKLSVNINGVWKDAVEYVNVNGIWKKVFEPNGLVAKWSGYVGKFHKLSDGTKSFSVRVSVSSTILTLTDIVAGTTTSKKIGDSDDDSGSGIVGVSDIAVVNNCAYFTARYQGFSFSTRYLFAFDANLNKIHEVRYYEDSFNYIGYMTGRGNSLYAEKSNDYNLVILNPTNLSEIKSVSVAIVTENMSGGYRIPRCSPENGMNTVFVYFDNAYSRIFYYRQYDLNLNLVRESHINMSAYLPPGDYSDRLTINYYNDNYVLATTYIGGTPYNFVYDLVHGTLVSMHGTQGGNGIKGNLFYFDGTYSWFGLTLGGGPSSFVRKVPGLTADYKGAGYVEYPLTWYEYVEEIRSAPDGGVVVTCPYRSILFKFR